MKKKKKYIHVGQYVAEVEVELLEADDQWAPYLSLEDAHRLDKVREALSKNDTKTAAQYGVVYVMHNGSSYPGKPNLF